MSRPRTGTLVFAATLLLAGNVLLWLWHSVLDAEPFVSTSSEVLREPSAREALAGRVVDTLLAPFPSVLERVRGAAVDAVERLLGTRPLTGVIDDLAVQLHRLLLDGGIDPVLIDVSAIKRAISAVTATVGRDLATARWVERQPDELVLFRGRRVPPLGRIESPAPWLAVGSIAAGFALLAWSVSGTSNPRRAMQRAGLAILAAALATGLLWLLLRTFFLVRSPSLDGDTLIAGLYDAFGIRLLLQSAVGALAGLGLLATGQLYRDASDQRISPP